MLIHSRDEAESLNCKSCLCHGQFSCVRSNNCYCDDHVKRKGVKYDNSKFEKQALCTLYV